MKNCYYSICQFAFLALFFSSAPAWASEACQAATSTFPDYSADLTQTRTGGTIAAAAPVSRKLRFGERLALRMLEKKCLKANNRANARAKNEPEDKVKGKNMNAASLILSLAAIAVFFAGLGAESGFFIVLSLALAAIGLVLGIIGVAKKYPNLGMGIGGIVLAGGGLIALFVAILVLLSNFE